MTKTTFQDPDWDDESEPVNRRFNRFRYRTASEPLRNLKIPVDILDRIEQFRQQNNLDQELIEAAAESGNKIAETVNEELTNVKLLAMEGLIVQQGLSSLSKTQAEVEQQQKVFDRNKQLVKRNQELERYVKDLILPVTWTQFKPLIPYISIAVLCLAAVTIYITQSNGRNTNSPVPTQSPTVQPQVLPSSKPSPGS